MPAAPYLTQTDLFVSGTDDYHTYRIPASVVTPRGALIAVCEGRRDSIHDFGEVDTLMKRSADGGETPRRPRSPAGSMSTTPRTTDGHGPSRRTSRVT